MSTNLIGEAMRILRSKGEDSIADALEAKFFAGDPVVAIRIEALNTQCCRCSMPTEGGYCVIFKGLREWDEMRGHHRLKACLEAEVK